MAELVIKYEIVSCDGEVIKVFPNEGFVQVEFDCGISKQLDEYQAKILSDALMLVLENG
jgi:hypothetical protein